MTNKYTTRTEEISSMEREFAAKAKDIIMASIKEFFVDHPEAIEVAWEQYTPYFNDGEPCTFGVHEPYLKLDPKHLAEDVQKQLGEPDEDEDGDLEDADDSLDYDTCAFNALTSVVRFDELNRWNKEKRTSTPVEQVLYDDFCALRRVLTSVPSVLETAFGDHVRVSATRDGFTTQEYDHE